jgi:hypothetical protein
VLITGDLHALQSKSDPADITVLRKPLPPSTLRQEIENHVTRPTMAADAKTPGR